MKQILNLSTNPDPKDLQDFVLQIIGENVQSISINPLSYDGLLKKVDEGKLLISEMDSDMKLSKSKFFHCVIKEENGQIQEMFIQRCDKTISEENPEIACRLAIYG